MKRSQRYSRVFGELVLVAAVGLAPGCTLFGDVFLPEQPVAEVTVVGAINIDPASGQEGGCSSGRALLWGTARNTGDLDVDDVFIIIDTLNASHGVLDTYRVNVFNGEVTEVAPPTTTETTTTEPPIQVAGTSLVVDQSGTFAVCTRQSYGEVAGTAYRTDFIIIDKTK